MSAENNETQPAFPVIYDGNVAAGLTKREYFAGLAMQGMLANNWNEYSERDEDCSFLARAAVNYADALLTSLSGETK